MAIAASLKSSEDGSQEREEEDSEDGSIIDVPLETFSEDEDVDYSLEDAEDKTSIKEQDSFSSAVVSPNKNTSDSKPGSSVTKRWKTSNGTLSNGSRLTGTNSAGAAAPLNAAAAAGASSSDSWRSLLSGYDESSDMTDLVIRLHDGSRDSLSLPRAAPLKVI